MTFKTFNSCVFPINALPACRLVKEGIDALSFSLEIKKKAVLEYYNQVDADILFCFSDIVIQAEAMGAKIKFFKDALPAVEKSADKVGLPRAEKIERMMVNSGVIRALSKEFPQKGIAGMVYGPFTVAGQLIGEQTVMKGLRENPAQILNLLKQCTACALDYATILIEAGANILWISDPFASLLSPLDFKKFAQGFLENIFDAFKKLPTALHICGDTTHLVKSMVETGVTGISFDQCMNLLTIEDMLPKQVEIIGNADPVEGIANASFQQIDSMVFNLASQMGVLPNFSLSTGCALPISTPIKNVIRFVNSSKKRFHEVQNGKQTLKDLGQAVFLGEQNTTVRIIQTLISKKVAPEIIIDTALMRAVKKGSSLYECGRFYLPDLLMLTDAFYQGFKMIHSQLPAVNKAPQVLLGVVQGDFHEIGKDIVKAMLEANGIPVIDLGVNVSAETFLDRTQKLRVPIIGLSAFTTSSRKEVKKITTLIKNYMPNVSRVIVGGAAVSASVANELGADGYAKDAVAAVSLTKQLLSGS